MLLDQSIKTLDKAEKYYKELPVGSAYNSLCLGRKQLFEPISETLEKKIERFMSISYEPLEFREGDTSEYYSNNGERVRSKSEKLIADALSNKGIPYRYEMPLSLEHNGRIIVFRPDFTVLNKHNGKKFILEHLGMLDKPEYLQNALDKINIYEKNGYLLGKDLIILHETGTDPLSTKVMKMYIEEFFI